MSACTLREDRADETDWVCYRQAGHEGRCRPKVSDEAKAFILDDDDEPYLNRALFDLADVFHIPLTNNGVTWVQENGDPVYCVSDFIETMRAVIAKYGSEVTAA